MKFKSFSNSSVFIRNVLRFALAIYFTVTQVKGRHQLLLTSAKLFVNLQKVAHLYKDIVGTVTVYKDIRDTGQYQRNCTYKYQWQPPTITI